MNVNHCQVCHTNHDWTITCGGTPTPCGPVCTRAAMTAPTARDRHAEHERTGQPCNCAGAQPMPTAREIADRARALFVEIMNQSSWPERIAVVESALRAERAAVWRAAAEVAESALTMTDDEAGRLEHALSQPDEPDWSTLGAVDRFPYIAGMQRTLKPLRRRVAAALAARGEENANG